MGVIVSRYLDERSSEGALVRFAIDSLNLVRTICTTDFQYHELTPWNVIDFNSHDITGYAPNRRGNERQEGHIEDSREQFIVTHYPVEFDNFSRMNDTDTLSLEPSSSSMVISDFEYIQNTRRVPNCSTSTADDPFRETIIPINEDSSQTDSTNSPTGHDTKWLLEHTI